MSEQIDQTEAADGQSRLTDLLGVKLYLVTHNGEPQAAYARKLQAEVYATGFSKNDGIEIIEGIFTPNA